MISNSAERRQRIKEQSKEVANYMNCIEPSPELVRKWQIKIEYCSKRADREAAVVKIFQLGADMELEACIKLLSDLGGDGEMIRRYRRPKPPSLKAQALQALEAADGADHPVVATVLTADQHALIRTALESLPD